MLVFVGLVGFVLLLFIYFFGFFFFSFSFMRRWKALSIISGGSKNLLSFVCV